MNFKLFFLSPLKTEKSNFSVFCLFFNGQYLQFLSVFWRGTILTHFFNERQWWLGQRFQRRHFWPLLSAIMEYSWKNPSSLWNQIKLLKNRDLPWNHILQTKNPNCILIPTWDTKLRSLSHFRKSEIWHWIRIFLFFMFQAIFDRRQNLTFDIGAFLKNPNLLVIPKSRCTVNLQRWSPKVKTMGEKN